MRTVSGDALGLVDPMEVLGNDGIFLPTWWWWHALKQTYRLLGAGDAAHLGVGLWIYALEETELGPEQ